MREPSTYFAENGIGNMNEAGRDLMEWCGEHGLAYANSYICHARRGTWFHRRSGKWYEIDGYLVRAKDRKNLIGKMRTVDVWDLSDHRAKTMELREKKKWRVQGAAGSAVPKIRFELLGQSEVKEEFLAKTRALMDPNSMNGEREWKNEWKNISETLIEAAKEVCGVQRKGPENPWMIGNEEEERRLRDNVQEKVNERIRLGEQLKNIRRLRRRNERIEQLEGEIERARENVRRARRDLKTFLREIEREWWQERIEECEEACATGRIGDMYKSLRKISMKGRKAGESMNITVNDFKEHFERVSKDRYENDPRVIEEVIGRVEDKRQDDRATEANECMNEPPTTEEVQEVMKEMKDSSPGDDGVRMKYIWQACQEIKDRVIILVKEMFMRNASEWDDSLKVGVIIPLFKKGDRNDRNNYRGVCLLAMCSRLFGRLLARRLAWWAEHLCLLDENQAGFRCGRSTADVTQIMMRMEEDAVDYKRRVQGRINERGEAEGEQEEGPRARLLDLQKAYPRVNKTCLWELLERYGLNGRFLESVKGLHETTEYKVKGKGGMSEGWKPERGLREGCPTSPILFNIYHQAVMRQAEERRREKAGIEGRELGVSWKWMPGSSFAGVKSWEKKSSETKGVKFATLLFADDTTLVGERVELEDGVRETKEVMNKWEERNNENKEEELEFGTEEGGKVRVLGSWVDSKMDVKNRIKRAGKAWWTVKNGLKGSQLSKRWQARIVQACVESSLMYDCQARVWYKRDMKKLQSWMDKCYRYVWSDRNGAPLRQMQERHLNMSDVRERLNVRSIECKIEKRVLERIGHVLRKGNENLTKVAVLGWYERLEEYEKCAGKKRKTVLFWKTILRNAGIDWTDVERLCNDRNGWKEKIKERMEHLYKWQAQKGHEYVWEGNEVPLERNTRVTASLVCGYEDCGKVCKSKAGLVAHQRRIHRLADDRVQFFCSKCNRKCETQGAKENHQRTCTGGRTNEGGNKRQCGKCERWITVGNYARHVRKCLEGTGDRTEEMDQRRIEGGNGRKRSCEKCSKWVSASNYARHLRGCRVWDPGGGPGPAGP